jgi:hypothetical protein
MTFFSKQEERILGVKDISCSRRMNTMGLLSKGTFTLVNREGEVG